MPSPSTTLELQTIPIQQTPITQMLKQLGCTVKHATRHYLAGIPVHCGEMLEIYADGDWILGRYEWTGSEDEEATLKTVDRILCLDGTQLLRWPEFHGK